MDAGHLTELKCNGIALDLSTDKFGELRDSSGMIGNIDALRTLMRDEGYLLFRGMIDRDTVLKARREIMLKYAIIGEIDAIRHPVMDAIYQPESFVEYVNLIAFAESIRTGKAYEDVVLHRKLLEFYEQFLGRPARCFDFKWPRFVRPGEGTGLHSDIVYVARGSRNLWSSWIPLGDVSKIEGALMVLENSHKADAVLGDYWAKDADKDHIGWISDDPLELQNSLGGRWLTTDFEAGDVLCFDVRLVHASLDNLSPVGRCRLSSDTRYQLASEPLDERWNGDIANPHGGAPKVFYPGLGRSNNNKEFEEEWKPVDAYGRLLRHEASPALPGGA